MKLGINNVFDENFDITFFLSKPMGYTPVGGLMAQSNDCVLTQCDPSADTRWPCERQCFSSSDECNCRCGGCEKPYCDCNDTSGNPTFGYFEDFISNEGAYNFGIPNLPQTCYAPGVSALETSGSACNCRQCPNSHGDPDPNADPTVCCLSQNQTKKCVSKANGQLLPPSPANGNIEGGHIWTTIDGSCLNLDQKYGCGCPTGYESKQPTKYYCTIGVNPECKEDVDGPYATMSECVEAITAGQCAERWKCKAAPDQGCESTTDWKAKFKTENECNSSNECVQKYYYCKWNQHGYRFECKETNNQIWTWNGGTATWYNSLNDCNEAINSGEGHCRTGYACRSIPSVSPYSECRKAPADPVPGQNAIGMGSPVWATEAECKTACCSATNYGEAFGMCTLSDRCGLMTRSQCQQYAGGYFTCCGSGNDPLGYANCGCPEEIPNLGLSCPGDSPTCTATQGRTYRYYYEHLLGGFFDWMECNCTSLPPNTPIGP